MLDPAVELNTAYYNGSVTPEDIANGKASNPGADKLVANVTAAGG